MYIHSKQHSAFKPFNRSEITLAPQAIYMPPPELMVMAPLFFERMTSTGTFVDIQEGDRFNFQPTLLIKKSSV